MFPNHVPDIYVLHAENYVFGQGDKTRKIMAFTAAPIIGWKQHPGSEESDHMYHPVSAYGAVLDNDIRFEHDTNPIVIRNGCFRKYDQSWGTLKEFMHGMTETHGSVLYEDEKGKVWTYASNEVVEMEDTSWKGLERYFTSK